VVALDVGRQVRTRYEDERRGFAVLDRHTTVERDDPDGFARAPARRQGDNPAIFIGAGLVRILEKRGAAGNPETANTRTDSCDVTRAP